MENEKTSRTKMPARIALILLAVMIVAAAYILLQVGKYMGILPAVIGTVILLIVAALLWMCGRKKPKLAIVLEILLLIVLAVGVFGAAKISSVAGRISRTTEYEVVQIVALKDSGIEGSDDFSDYRMGYVNSDDGAYERSGEILGEHDKKVKVGKPYETTPKLYSDFQEETTELMVLTSNTRSDLSVIDEEYEDKIKVLFEKQYALQTAELKPVDITKEPFTIYLCGADLSAGQNINSTGRGDVNILLTVNPKTEQVNLQAVPRDTFVYIPSRGGRSKLSYSGWWGGVQSSIQSIEDKFDIEINYYAKINFNGLVDLVDALGGVTAYSHYTYSYQGYDFVEGYNELDGEKALRFVRARKMLPQNELSRGQHQMELIKAIFKKFAENPTYENSIAVLNALGDNFVTNLPEEDYYDAFRLVVKLLPQLQNMENKSIEGEYKWHYDEIRESYYQYYYYPTESEIKRVKAEIDAVMQK